MLAYLLDENISYVVADQVVRKNPLIDIHSVHRWQGGAYIGQQDGKLLRAARAANLTLVTYDLKTIPQLLGEFAAEGESHAGILFVDGASIHSSDFGGLVKALLSHWKRYSGEEWTDRLAFLEPL